MENYDGRIPLHSAVMDSNVNIVRLLLDNGADVLRVNSDGESILHYCFSREICEMVLDKNEAVLNITDNMNR